MKLTVQIQLAVLRVPVKMDIMETEFSVPVCENNMN